MWGKYCRIYPEFATTKNGALFKGTTYAKIYCLITQDKMKNRFYQIKCTAVSDQVWYCQPKIVILNNICHSVTTTGVS